MNEFRVVFKNGKGAQWVFAEYVLPVSKKWEFYSTTKDGEQIVVASYPLDDTITIVQEDE